MKRKGLNSLLPKECYKELLPCHKYFIKNVINQNFFIKFFSRLNIKKELIIFKLNDCKV